MKTQSKELIRLWDFFDETMEYEEDPSGTHAGIVQIKTKRENDYRAYQICLRHIDEMQKGPLKVNRDRSIKVLQILFLNFIAKRSIHSGISGDDLANGVLIEKSANATVQENVEQSRYGRNSRRSLRSRERIRDRISGLIRKLPVSILAMYSIVHMPRQNQTN